MKTLRHAIFLLLIGLCGPLMAEAPSGKHTTDLNVYLVALLESASVNSTAWAGNETTWESIRTDRHLQVSYADAVMAKVPSADGKSVMTIRFNELLLPLPAKSNPSHILVRSEGKLLAFTKFSPEALAKVVCDASVDLGREERYAGYCRQVAVNKP